MGRAWRAMTALLIRIKQPLSCAPIKRSDTGLGDRGLIGGELIRELSFAVS
jgi:hypothetical protein